MGWGQVVGDHECQGKKNKQEHLEYKLKGGAKVSNLAVWLLKRKDHGNLTTPEKQEFVFVISRTGSCD